MDHDKSKFSSSKSSTVSFHSKPAAKPQIKQCLICPDVFDSTAEMHTHMSYEHGVPLYQLKYPSPEGGQSKSGNKIGANQAEAKNVQKHAKSIDLSGKQPKKPKRHHSVSEYTFKPGTSHHIGPSASRQSQVKQIVRPKTVPPRDEKEHKKQIQSKPKHTHRDAKQFQARKEKPQKSQIQSQLAAQPQAEKCIICPDVFNSTAEMHNHMSNEHGVALPLVYRPNHSSPARGQSSYSMGIGANQTKAQNVPKQDKPIALLAKRPKRHHSDSEYTSKQGTSRHIGPSTSQPSQAKPSARQTTVQPTSSKDEKVFKKPFPPKSKLHVQSKIDNNRPIRMLSKKAFKRKPRKPKYNL